MEVRSQTIRIGPELDPHVDYQLQRIRASVGVAVSLSNFVVLENKLKTDRCVFQDKTKIVEPHRHDAHECPIATHWPCVNVADAGQIGSQVVVSNETHTQTRRRPIHVVPIVAGRVECLMNSGDGVVIDPAVLSRSMRSERVIRRGTMQR